MFFLVKALYTILAPERKIGAEIERYRAQREGERRLEAEAQRKAEEERLHEQERQRSEEEVKRKADEENRRRIEEERNRAQREAEQRRLEAEAQQKEVERLREKERQPAEEEARRKAEEKFFFSYARADKDFVLKLADDLRSHGINLWLDQLDIPGGVRWDDAVEDALHASPCLLVVLSPASVASDNVKDEISFGLENRKTIVPILHKECAIPLRLQRFQYIDFRVGYEDGIKRLIQALEPTYKPPRPPYALGKKATEGETDLLERLRRQMLVARTSWELRELLYELDDYLGKFPLSPEARLLKDKMQAAMRHAEQMEGWSILFSARKSQKTLLWSLTLLLILLVVLGYIVYGLLLFLGVL